MKRGLMLTIFTGLLIVDQSLKLLAKRFLFENEPIVLIKGFIRLNYSENTGASFGMLKDRPQFLFFFNIIVLSVLLYFLLFKGIRNKVYEFCFLLVVSGGIGNIIDRIFRGYVVDFIEPTFINFAIFNFADSAITVGSVFLLVYLIYETVRDFKKEGHE